MSPQQDNIGQSRSSSLSGETRISSCRKTEKKMKSLAQRRQSAPSFMISKALNKTRTLSRESCLSPVSPELCPLLRSVTGPHRTFLMEGPVQLKIGLQTQDRHLFLFNDVLVIAKSKSVTHFKLKKQVKVSEVWMTSYTDGVCEGSTSAEQSFVLGWPTTNCVATFSSIEQKEKWLCCLQSCIKEEKEKEHPKNIPLKILTRNVASCVYSKVLTVKNTDTANDVVAMTLQHFGIMGSSKDYQLWVTSGKEDTPYPLIGHEYPFSIKMSHIQSATGQTQGSKDAIYPLDFQGPFIIEQLPVEMQCQFILKPSHLASCQHMADPSQKQCKRKRSIMNWAFKRGSGIHLENMPTSHTSITPRGLFGLPLSTICENDNFPKPIMDMLFFLFHEGPYTRGIFRRSANAKSCKELKEKLNAGAAVHLAGESVFVTAAVFKDFLRNIPGSIFSSDLYDEWMAAMERNSHEEKIKEIQRLLDQLPRLNTLLLHYLFGVLHKIEQQAEENQMNAFNLAVCIAPSTLWPSTLCSPETECKSTKKVALFVQFLIENCSRIFGDVFTSLFEVLSSRRFGSRDDGSDLPSFQMHDSSYNSLENELNDETDSALMTKRSQETRSRDSVLSWSDCDLDQAEDEAAHRKVPLTMKSLQIPPASLEESVICQFSNKALLDSSSSGYSTCETLTDPRRHRRCSEPSIVPSTSQFVQLCQSRKPLIRKTSCDAVLSQTAENCIEQLQIGGQNLTKHNVKESTDLGGCRNSGHKSDRRGSLSNGQHRPPPPLKIQDPSTMSSSSLSSPGTPFSGSSVSSCDSVFKYNPEYFVFTPSETFSPSCYATQSQKGQLAMLPSPGIFKYFPGQLSPGYYPSSLPGSSSTALEKDKRTSSVTEDIPTSIAGKNDRRSKESGTCMLRKMENGGKLEGAYFEGAHGQLSVSVAEGESMIQNADKSQCANLPPYPEGVGSLLLNTAAKEKGSMVRPLQHLLQSDSWELANSSITRGSPSMSTASKAFPGQSGPYRIPQTVFYGQNSVLCFQSKPCQQSSPFMVDGNSSHSALDRHSFKRVSCPSLGNAKVSEERGRMLQEEKLFPPLSGDHTPEWEARSRRPKALSSNAAKTVRDYFFLTDAENCLVTTQRLTNAAIQDKKGWQKECCTNPKFENFEQVFFSEESYV
ncbi:rho GTPase-activating protein 20-like isoform X1 [Mobula hypostoma]|uniref:rho GTPase-activating protein 20-like isoform X1 n=2 Tax=Mobula hypostoma TaxID=723540 RepID=UPI002FC32907